MTNTNPDAALLRNLFEAYCVHGGDAASSVDLARELRSAEVVALSILYYRRAGAPYRIVTLASGERYLAVRYRGRTEWLPVFSVARLERLVEMGWRLAHAA